MQACPVCEGPAGAPPRFDETEVAARREASKIWKWFVFVEVGTALIVCLLAWLL